MIITKERRKEIEETLLKARPYFRKNSSTPGLIINFDSSDEDISKEEVDAKTFEVSQMFKYSAAIIDTDYYKYLLGE